MTDTSKRNMYETDVTYLEDKVVSAAFSWLALNLDVPWNDAPDKPGKCTILAKFMSLLFTPGKVISASILNGSSFLYLLSTIQPGYMS
jgi:hypothetical protein